MQRRRVAVPLPTLRVFALLATCAPAFLSLSAQISTSPSTGTRTSRPTLPGDPRDDDPFRDNPVLRERIERGRAADRQRRIVDDANRLVTLTAQYRKSLEAHGTPTEEDQKLLVQIEKLAREVKDRMRGM